MKRTLGSPIILDRFLDPPDDEPGEEDLQAAEQEQDRQGQLAADDAAWDRAHPDRWPE